MVFKITDVAVGSFRSGHVLILRTQPVIRVVNTVTIRPRNIDYRIDEVTVESCIFYSGQGVPNSLCNYFFKIGLLLASRLINNY